LELKPEEVMMCAAHSGDLMSARSFGLRTGFIHRPKEYGPTRKTDDAKPGDFDVVSSDMLDLASRLRA
jgi:2-haloacid dehalogenase